MLRENVIEVQPLQPIVWVRWSGKTSIGGTEVCFLKIHVADLFLVLIIVTNYPMYFSDCNDYNYFYFPTAVFVVRVFVSFGKNVNLMILYAHGIILLSYISWCWLTNSLCFFYSFWNINVWSNMKKKKKNPIYSLVGQSSSQPMTVPTFDPSIWKCHRTGLKYLHILLLKHFINGHHLKPLPGGCAQYLDSVDRAYWQHFFVSLVFKMFWYAF